jgi:hypothetical protein
VQDDRDLRARLDRLYVCAKAKRCVHAAADAVRAFDRSIAPLRSHILMRPANRPLLKVGKVRLVRLETFLSEITGSGLISLHFQALYGRCTYAIKIDLSPGLYCPPRNSKGKPEE